MANKILICDDDQGILDMMDTILTFEGFEIIPEPDSTLVVDLAISEEVDLIIIDLWMPLMPGYEVIRSLKDDPRTSSLPVLAISASPDGRNVAMEAGAVDLVPKPFDIDKLIGRINELLGDE
jgi:DNA-binding response OmpR family regulator